MIISNLIGGLGNQMFQYAAGRSLALRCGVEFKVDLSEFSSYPLHQGFELDRIFNCPISIASTLDLKEALGWRRNQLYRKLLSRLSISGALGKGFMVEPHFHYWNGLGGSIENAYLAGYWQSEKYFIENEDQIRNDFQFKSPLIGKNLLLADEIGGTNSIGIHIRRGDYVSNPKAHAVHGVCSIDYYSRAIGLVEKTVTLPKYFIFSDDIYWAKKNLNFLDDPVFIDHNIGADSYKDMQLMSLCKHNIIANSSFSWWGAWLNQNKQKVVIAPNCWFVNGNNIKDLLPSEWMRI